MGSPKRVRLAEGVRTALDRIPKTDPVGVVIWAALEAFRRGDLEPQVLAGKHGWHTIQMQDGRLVRLGLKRPDADTVEVHLLKVMKRR